MEDINNTEDNGVILRNIAGNIGQIVKGIGMLLRQGMSIKIDNGTFIDEDKYEEDTRQYKLVDFARDCYGIEFNKIDINLDNSHQLILVGVPGVGKTTIALAYVRAKTGYVKSKYYELITFGEDWDRSDFTGGTVNVDGVWRRQKGIFTKMCERALADRSHNYYLIIDEINRGNTAGIMADAFTGLSQRDVRYRTQLGEYITVPSNLYIIGTMNAFDSSISDLDMAMKNRFPFIELDPVWNDPGFASNLTRIIGAIENGWDSPWLRQLLKRIANDIAALNNAIMAQGRVGNAALIGVRPIYKKFKSLEHFRESYNNELLHTIKDSTEFVQDVPEISDYIKDLEGVLEDIDRVIRRDSTNG